MATANKILQSQQIWKSRRYLTLIHAAVLSAAASSMALGAPKSAKIVALNKANGSTILSAWLWRSESAASGTGVVAGNTLFFVQDQKLLRSLDLQSGKLRWEAKLAEPVIFTPVLGDSKIVAYSRDHLWAFALKDGKAIWDAKLPDDNGPWTLTDQQHPIFGEGLVMACSGKQIVGLNAEDGEVQWIYAGHSIRANQIPIAENDRIYLRTTTPDSPWVRLSLLDGTPLSEEADPEDIVPPSQAIPATNRPAGSGYPAISADRRTLTIRAGRRICKYQVPAPSIISGIVGETPTAICIQVVEPGASPSRPPVPMTKPTAPEQPSASTAPSAAAPTAASTGQPSAAPASMPSGTPATAAAAK